jgi:hypothetical protein
MILIKVFPCKRCTIREIWSSHGALHDVTQYRLVNRHSHFRQLCFLHLHTSMYKTLQVSSNCCLITCCDTATVLAISTPQSKFQICYICKCSSCIFTTSWNLVEVLHRKQIPTQSYAFTKQTSCSVQKIHKNVNSSESGEIRKTGRVQVNAAP